jgi:hypothetical protein
MVEQSQLVSLTWSPSPEVRDLVLIPRHHPHRPHQPQRLIERHVGKEEKGPN